MEAPSPRGVRFGKRTIIAAGGEGRAFSAQSLSSLRSQVTSLTAAGDKTRHLLNNNIGAALRRNCATSSFLCHIPLLRTAAGFLPVAAQSVLLLPPARSCLHSFALK